MFICVCLKDGGLGWSWGKMCGGGKNVMGWHPLQRVLLDSQ